MVTPDSSYNPALDAAALNSGSGINLGSSPDKWVMTGAVTDA